MDREIALPYFHETKQQGEPMAVSDEKDLELTLRQLIRHDDRQVRDVADMMYNILRRIRQRTVDQQTLARFRESTREVTPTT